MYKLVMSNYHEPVNIGNPREMTIKEFGEHIIQVTNTKSTMVYRSLPANDPKQRQPDITLAHNLLNWEPKVSFEEGILKTIGFFRNK